MKKLLTILLVLCIKFASAQEYNQCGIIIPPKNRGGALVNVNETKLIIKNILDSINWKSNFIIQEKDGINNAYASVLNGQRYIIYDNIFLTNLDKFAGTKWASISIIAHEIGHHYLNHVMNGMGSRPDTELEADYFSGYVLAKLGASLNDATAAMKTISSEAPSSTHPGRSERVAIISRGWNYQHGNVLTNNTAKKPLPAPQPKENPPPSNNTAEWINLYLYGNNNMTVFLSDDGKKYASVQLRASQPYVFKYEVYDYGYLRFVDDAQNITYKLVHGNDYAIIWNRKTNYWTVIEVPEKNSIK